MGGEQRDRQDTAVAVAVGGRRDLLGQACHILHIAVMLYFVVGWLAPWRPALGFYLAFVPAVALQWQVNKNACILNNLESWLRSRRWRDPANREEGAWLASLCEDWLGFRPGPLAVDLFTYAVLAVFWAIALIHLLCWKF